LEADGSEISVSSMALRKGELVIVRLGEIIPADGLSQAWLQLMSLLSLESQNPSFGRLDQIKTV